MKAEGAWKKYFSDKKSDALPREVPGARPGERLEWHRAIPTEVDPWSRPFSFWDRPCKRVCADSLSGGVYSCGSQSCRSKSFGSETAFWQHLAAKSHTRGHPDKTVMKKWEQEVSEGVEYVPLLIDPNWVSGLQELKQQEELKQSMTLRLQESLGDGEQGEESDSTHDTQVSVAPHSEVIVTEATYVRDLTTYKPKAEPAAEEKAVKGVPAKDPEINQDKKEDAKDPEAPAQEKEEKEK